jgi:hypothetical protein
VINCSATVKLAKMQLAMEISFRRKQDAATGEEEERVARIKAKMQHIMTYKQKRITVHEMNRLYDQVRRF